jgi:hypothetical protein
MCMQICVGVLSELKENAARFFSNTRLTNVFSLMRQSIQRVDYDGWLAQNCTLKLKILNTKP